MNHAATQRHTLLGEHGQPHRSNARIHRSGRRWAPTVDHQDLIDHLLDTNGPLWVPGAKPHARNEPVSFDHRRPALVRPHPINPTQTAVVLGTIADFGPRNGLHAIALAHLAHDLTECRRCEPVWQAAADQWAQESSNDTLFGIVELTTPTGAPYRLNRSTVSLLVHVNDLPPGWSRESVPRPYAEAKYRSA